MFTKSTGNSVVQMTTQILAHIHWPSKCLEFNLITLYMIFIIVVTELIRVISYLMSLVMCLTQTRCIILGVHLILTGDLKIKLSSVSKNSIQNKELKFNVTI